MFFYFSTLIFTSYSCRSLSALMYGLQGMENHSPEVKQLVAAIGVKLSAADEVPYCALMNSIMRFHSTRIISNVHSYTNTYTNTCTYTFTSKFYTTDLTDFLMFTLSLGWLHIPGELFVQSAAHGQLFIGGVRAALCHRLFTRSYRWLRPGSFPPRLCQHAIRPAGREQYSTMQYSTVHKTYTCQFISIHSKCSIFQTCYISLSSDYDISLFLTLLSIFIPFLVY